MDDRSRTTWLFVLDWGVAALTLTAAGASLLAALIAFHRGDRWTLVEAGLAFVASVAAAWAARAASSSARRWQQELTAWHGNDIVLLLAEDGRVVDANDRAHEAYGHGPEEISRRNVRDLRHPSAGDGIEGHLAELHAKGRATFETLHRRDDGSPFPIEVSARVVSIRGRRFFHFIGRDVSEAHLARERVLAAERLAAVGAVAAGMAHDVNNPLCGVIGNISFASEALSDERPDVAEVQQALSDAHSAARRVRDLMRDLSAFANAFGEPDGESDLRSVVDRAVEATGAHLDGRARVVVDVPPLPPVKCPPQRLSPVFVSILRRAADALPEGALRPHEIRIVARREGAAQLAVEVADDGPALAAGELAGPLDPPARPATRGGGAGLAAVIGMVRAVGGDVAADSGPGRGTIVRLLLPIVSSLPDLRA